LQDAHEIYDLKRPNPTKKESPNTTRKLYPTKQQRIPMRQQKTWKVKEEDEFKSQKCAFINNTVESMETSLARKSYSSPSSPPSLSSRGSSYDNTNIGSGTPSSSCCEDIMVDVVIDSELAADCEMPCTLEWLAREAVAYIKDDGFDIMNLSGADTEIGTDAPVSLSEKSLIDVVTDSESPCRELAREPKKDSRFSRHCYR
jgi:hypothetical protein